MFFDVGRGEKEGEREQGRSTDLKKRTRIQSPLSVAETNKQEKELCALRSLCQWRVQLGKKGYYGGEVAVSIDDVVVDTEREKKFGERLAEFDERTRRQKV